MNIYPIKEDNWLSSFINKKSFAVVDSEYFFCNHQKDALIIEWKDYISKNQSFTFCKIPISSVDLIHIAEEIGFKLVDTNIQFIKTNLEIDLEEDHDIQFSSTDDMEAVMELAEKSFIYSRFHLDPNIDNTTANKIKSHWTGNYYSKKRGDYMVVAKKNKLVVGFVQIIKEVDGYIIDLIAVHSEYRKMGYANKMINYANKMIPGINYVKVGTQIANIPSINFYYSMGFRISSSQYVFHLST